MDEPGNESQGIRSLASRPLTEQVRAELVRSIAGGHFADGKLPSETELADQLSVSRATVRAALASLVEEGVISRRRGRGTTINAHVAKGLSLSRVIGFYDLIREAGYEPSIADTTVSYGPPTPEAAESLGCKPDARLLHIERTFLADGHAAIQVGEMALPDRVRGVVTAAEVPNTIFDFAEAFSDTRVDHTIVRMRPGLADGKLADAIELRPGDPYLRLFETHYSPEGTPFMFSDIALVDKYISFFIVRRRF